MAKARAICKCEKCGAEFVREKICRNRAEADNFEKWAVENFTLCGACWKKEQDEKAAAKDAEFPPIKVGSEKQIAWAIKIRLAAVEKLRDYIQPVTENDDEEDKKTFVCMTRLLAAITSHEDARWYIDHQNALEYGVYSGVYRKFWRELLDPIIDEYEKENV